jgi:hypothetical protein
MSQRQATVDQEFDEHMAEQLLSRSKPGSD